MKSVSAYCLTIFYIIAICKPVIPVAKDMLAHFFWKAEHIATVHHHHGDHHAEEEISKATNEEENNKAPSASKTSEPVSIHLNVQSFYATPQFPIGKTKFDTIIYNTSSLFLDKHYPPPRSC